MKQTVKLAALNVDFSYSAAHGSNSSSLFPSAFPTSLLDYVVVLRVKTSWSHAWLDFFAARISECGRKTPVVANIVNGALADEVQYPWHVGIFDKNYVPDPLDRSQTVTEQICGGTIISPNVVVSGKTRKIPHTSLHWIQEIGMHYLWDCIFTLEGYVSSSSRATAELGLRHLTYKTTTENKPITTIRY